MISASCSSWLAIIIIIITPIQIGADDGIKLCIKLLHGGKTLFPFRAGRLPQIGIAPLCC